jgi:hypothetical protein
MAIVWHQCNWRPALPDADSALAWFARPALLAAAWSLAYVTILLSKYSVFFPNDSSRALLASNTSIVGLAVASLAFVLGGVWGALTGDWVLTFGPGTLLIVTVFRVLISSLFLWPAAEAAAAYVTQASRPSGQ